MVHEHECFLTPQRRKMHPNPSLIKCLEPSGPCRLNIRVTQLDMHRKKHIISPEGGGIAQNVGQGMI